MKKVLMIVLLCAAACFAQNSFDGTWKWNVDKTQFAQKPDVFSLQNGMYKCSTCVPEVNVKADGTDQPVSGHPGYNSIAIKQVDDHTIQTVRKMDGKVVGETSETVENNGNTLNVKFTDYPVNGDPVKGAYTMARVKKGVSGSHPISGSWRIDKFSDISENGMMMTFKMEGDHLMMTAPTGEKYSAKLDGQDYPYMGNYGISHVALRRLNDNTIEETDKKDGKVLSVSRMSLSPDGKKLMVVSDDKIHGTTNKFELDRQPSMESAK
jgi:hypothetical protein